MKFHFENLGSIKKADVELGNLTVVCGKNNTGKTYLTYAVWHIIRTYEDNLSFNIDKEATRIANELRENKYSTLEISVLKKSFEKSREKLSKEILDLIELNSVFNTGEETFINTISNFILPNLEIDFAEEINLKWDTIIINKEENASFIEFSLSPRAKKMNRQWTFRIKFLLKILFINKQLINPQLFCAERINLNSMRYELDRYRLKIQELAEKEPDKYSEIMEELDSSEYPEPIEEHLNFIRNLEDNFSEKSDLSKDILDYIEDFLGIKYQVVDDRIMVIDKKLAVAVPYHLGSSSVKSLSDIYFWLKHYAKKGELLMIDEPEISLHPENQVKLARLLVKLVNAGIKVWITTHSDYIVKELNNLLVLSNEFEGKEAVMTELGYDKSDILKKEDARFYITYYDKDLQGCTVEQVKIDEFGLQKSAFDEAMLDIDKRTDKIFSAVERQKETSYQHESHISQVAKS